MAGHSAIAGEHARRAAAELLVIAGDAGRLDSGKHSALQIQGLRARIRGGLSGLGILMRLADQEKGRLSPDYGSIVQTARDNFEKDDLPAFLGEIKKLITRHPLQVPGILSVVPPKPGIARAADLHSRFCAGCHAEPDLEVSRPAYNLFEEINKMPPQEFAARMIIGVRGDRITGIGNPLTDTEISALITYYRAGN